MNLKFKTLTVISALFLSLEFSLSLFLSIVLYVTINLSNEIWNLKIFIWKDANFIQLNEFLCGNGSDSDKIE